MDVSRTGCFLSLSSSTVWFSNSVADSNILFKMGWLSGRSQSTYLNEILQCRILCYFLAGLQLCFLRLVIQWNRRKQPVCTWWFSWQLNCCVILLYYYYYFNHQLLVSDIFMAFVMYRDRCVFLVQSSFEGVQLLWFILPPKGNRSFCSKDCLVKSSSSSLLCWFLSYFKANSCTGFVPSSKTPDTRVLVCCIDSLSNFLPWIHLSWHLEF